MRRVAVLLLAVAGVAHADGPSTRIGLYGGARTILGSLGSRYDIGGVMGIEAGWVPGALGFVWWGQYSRFAASESQNPVESVKLWELGAAVRGRVAFRGDIPAFGYAQLGVTIMRSSTALEAEGATDFVGPTMGLGAEWTLGTLIVGLGADYGLLVGGPSGLQVVIKIGAGTR